MHTRQHPYHRHQPRNAHTKLSGWHALAWQSLLCCLKYLCRRKQDQCQDEDDDGEDNDKAEDENVAHSPWTGQRAGWLKMPQHCLVLTPTAPRWKVSSFASARPRQQAKLAQAA
ncbi:hypothetical protein ACLKA6_002878 [Drosophila palustris]